MVSVGLCGISFNLPPSHSISFPPCRRRRSRKKNSASRAKLPNKPLDFQVIPRPTRMPLPVLSRGFFPGHWRDSKPDKYKCTGHMTHDLIQNQLKPQCLVLVMQSQYLLACPDLRQLFCKHPVAVTPHSASTVRFKHLIKKIKNLFYCEGLSLIQGWSI